MDISKLVVVKSNRIIEAGYQLSLCEQRLLLACIAQINSKEELLETRQFNISARDMVDIYKADSLDNTYEILKRAAEKLFDRRLSIDIQGLGLGSKKTGRIDFRWLNVAAYLPNEGMVMLKFSAEIAPYLSLLSKEFTHYKLESVTKFRSVYSIRLYELLMQWKDVGKREIELQWLKNQLEVEDNYPNMCDFKKRVINIAIKEINEHSDIHISPLKQRKAGRIVTHFIFTFALKEPLKTSSKPTKTKPLIPLFTGHPEYTVDSEAVLADHQRLKTKPEPKSKKTLDSAILRAYMKVHESEGQNNKPSNG